MLFSIFAILSFLATIMLIIAALSELVDVEPINAGILGILALCSLGLGAFLQTHQIVPVQTIAITRSTFSQELSGPYPAGLVSKPFFGSVYTYPASNSYEYCEQYTPAIKGSYGITLDICFYLDTAHVNWLKEIQETGSLDANAIMTVWRNSVVSGIAQSVKDFTPEELSDNRLEVEQALFANVTSWFSERGITLVRISFKNWDFTSEEVAQSFDESIVSQRKITEQAALLEAAKISRERELYEAETAKQVAEQQRLALESLGLNGENAIQYLWIKMLTESNQIPDVIILGNSNVPVALPIQEAP